jgi:hypothetical protein
MCHPCRMMRIMRNKTFSKNADPTFSASGFNNWKDAARRFDKHEASKAHTEAAMKWCTYVSGINVTSQLNAQVLDQQKKSRSVLLKILSTLQFLTRQGLAVRGHTAGNGNFDQLLHLRSEDDAQLKPWLASKNAYVSHDVQNEYMTLMAHHVLRSILSRVRQAKYFSIIGDEVTDQSRQHQLGLSVRWVDAQFVVHEDFLELYLLPQGDAETITKMIMDTLLRYQLPLTYCRGQCFDGASVMAGNITGVSTRIAEQESRAVFVHCLAHSLNLALQESVRGLPMYRDLIEYVKDIINMIRASPKRSSFLLGLQQDNNKQPVKALRPLCPTRWTTRTESIQSLLDNYVAVQETLTEVAATDKSESGAKASGLAATMQTFHFYFALKTALMVFAKTEILSKILQAKTMTVTSASKAAETTQANLQRYRQDQEWNVLWKSCLDESTRLELDNPVVPRTKRPPKRIDDGSAPVILNAQDYFRMQFYQFLDNILETMRRRLQQNNLQLYATVEDTILSAANGQISQEVLSNRLTTICAHFKDDIDSNRLRVNFEMIQDLMNQKEAKTLADVTEALMTLGPAQRLYSELVKLIVLLLVIPATSATAERSFSGLRRLKNYLRATMGQQRLNSVLILNVHQEETDNLDLVAVARDFTALNEHRRAVFGQF